MDWSGWVGTAGGLLVGIGGIVYGILRNRAQSAAQREARLVEALNRSSAGLEKLTEAIPRTVEAIAVKVHEELDGWRRETLLAEIDELRKERPQ